MADHAPRIETGELDEFFLGERDRPRPLKAAGLIALLRLIARPDGSPLDDPTLAPHLRTMVWRWCRAAAQAVGRCGDDDLLETALEGIEPEPWTHRLTARPTPSQRALLRQGATSAMYEAVSGIDAIPLLPPSDGARAARWSDAFLQVADDLAFRRAPRGPDCLAVLGDPDLVVHLAIAPAAIMAVEELIASSAATVLQRHGEAGVVEHFRDRMGLSRREGLNLVRLARAWTLLYGRSSVEDDRALMVASLKDALARARETLNLGDELKILRELARVQGLTRSEPEDRAAEFLGVVRRVAGRQDALSLVPAAAEALGADPAELAEAVDSAVELPMDVDFSILPPRMESFDPEDAVR